jgi:hypothetical protein
VVNVSGGVRVDGYPSGTLALAGVAPLQSDLLWVEDSRRLAARMEVTDAAIRVAYHDISTGALIYSRTVADTTQARGVWGDAIGEVTDSFAAGDSFQLGFSPINLRNPTAYLSAQCVGIGTATIDVNFGEATVGQVTLTAGESGLISGRLELSRGLKQGTQVELYLSAVSPYLDLRGPLSLNFTGNLPS